MDTDTNEAGTFALTLFSYFSNSFNIPVGASIWLNPNIDDTNVTFSSQDIPSELTLDNGVIKGTFSSEGEYTFTVTATSSSTSMNFTITLTVLPNTFCNYETQYYKTGSTILNNPQTTGDWNGTITYQGDGVDSITYNNVNGQIAGTAPTTPGTYTIETKCLNVYGDGTFDYGCFYINYSIPVIVLNELTSIYETLRYNYQINNSITINPIADDEYTTYTITSGELPASLIFNTTTGVISGTLTEYGEFVVTVEADNNVSTVSEILIITVNSPITAFNYSSATISIPETGFNNITITPYIVGTDYSCFIESGTLPEGLIMDTMGVITSEDNVIENISVTLTIVCENNLNSMTCVLTINVVPVNTLFNYPSLYKTRVGNQISINPSVIPVGTNQYSISNLPNFLTVNGSSGEITGNATEKSRITLNVNCQNTLVNSNAMTKINYVTTIQLAINGPLYSVYILNNHFVYLVNS